jgi:hypothetical protein
LLCGRKCAEHVWGLGFDPKTPKTTKKDFLCRLPYVYGEKDAHSKIYT